MSRWFRHYAGMMRDEKLVSAAVKSKQPVHLVTWVYGAILESAAEIDDGGRYEFDCGEAAYFLRCEMAYLTNIVDALERVGFLSEGLVVGWCGSFDRPPKEEWGVIRSRVFERDDYSCRYCGSRDQRLECDHIVPVSRGGNHHDSNLATACMSCNRRKRNRTPEEMGWTL